jgi:DNA repair protein RAD50
MLKRTASDVMRMHRECEDIARDIAKLESELSASGSTATSEDIQSQLSELSEKMCARLPSFRVRAGHR